MPFRTKQITIKGERHKLNPEWRTELWQPVTVPCMSGNIKVRYPFCFLFLFVSTSRPAFL